MNTLERIPKTVSTGLKQALFSAYILLFSACSSTHDGNHLNILQLPGAMVSSGIENAVYVHRRQKVASYAGIHYEALKKEIRKGSGAHLDRLLHLAEIPRSHYTKVKQQLRRDYTVVFHNTQHITEHIMHTFGRLYISEEKTKRLNGFSYTRAYHIVKNYVHSHFDTLRLDIKNGGTAQLSAIASRLRINDAAKRAQFIHSLDGQYYQMYVDKVVVSVMVYGG